MKSGSLLLELMKDAHTLYLNVVDATEDFDTILVFRNEERLALLAWPPAFSSFPVSLLLYLEVYLVWPFDPHAF